MPESGAVSRETLPMRWLTDRGLLIAGGDTLGLCRRLAEARLPGVAELVPADGSLLVVLAPGSPIPAGLPDILNGIHAETADAITGRLHEIPVRFDGADLAGVAERAALPVTAIVDLLCSLTLGVKFLGFQPGFAYLDGLPPELHIPRLARPRKQIPAGSVALGGAYCGIYPSAGPGGWHWVGTTDMPLFDPAVAPPARLQPGDSVKLVVA